MTRIRAILTASAAVFAGSLLADQFLGDGIQSDDVEQAVFVALIAGLAQLWLNSRTAKRG